VGQAIGRAEGAVESLNRTRQLPGSLSGGEPRHDGMVPGVYADGKAIVCLTPHQARISLDMQAYDKERGRGVRPLQRRKYRGGVIGARAIVESKGDILLGRT